MKYEDTYNKAVKYLKDRYGVVSPIYIDSDDIVDFNDLQLILLVDQYHLGITPKLELKNLVESMAI